MDFAGKVLSLKENIVVKVIDNEAVIVSPNDALITSLNHTGTFILELIEKGVNSYSVILAHLIETFEISESEAGTDLQEFLSVLIENNLIKVS